MVLELRLKRLGEEKFEEEREGGRGISCRRDHMDADTEARENGCLKIHSLLSRSEMKITWAVC